MIRGVTVAGSPPELLHNVSCGYMQQFVLCRSYHGPEFGRGLDTLVDVFAGGPQLGRDDASHTAVAVDRAQDRSPS